jgi:hypothetical protein
VSPINDHVFCVLIPPVLTHAFSRLVILFDASMSVLSVDGEGFPESVSLLAHLVLDGLPLRFVGTLHTHTRSGRATLIALPAPL